MTNKVHLLEGYSEDDQGNETPIYILSRNYKPGDKITITDVLEITQVELIEWLQGKQ